MSKVCLDLLVLQGKLESRRDHQRQKFREETRVTQDFQAPAVIQAIQDLLVPRVARKEKKENQEKQANEANQEKTVTLVLQVSPEAKESQVFLVLQAGMAREDKKVIVGTQAPQEW